VYSGQKSDDRLSRAAWLSRKVTVILSINPTLGVNDIGDLEFLKAAVGTARGCTRQEIGDSATFLTSDRTA